MINSMKETIEHRQFRKEGFPLPLERLFERDVVYLKSSDTVYDAAIRMVEDHIGDVVVVSEENGRTIPVGIVTDRDVVIHATAQKKDPESIKLGQITNKRVVLAKENDDLSTLVRLFTDEGVSRLPIVDGEGELRGILSSKKLIQYLTQGLCELSSLSMEQQRREKKFTH